MKSDSPYTLDLTIYRAEAGYRVEISHDDPTSHARGPTLRGEAALSSVDLLALHGNSAAYGGLLFDQTFTDPKVRARFLMVEAASQAADRLLRITVSIDPSAAELQALRWELLAHPETGRMLATSERILLSRFMASSDFRPIQLRARTELAALVAVSAPYGENFQRLQLSPVDFAGEVARARKALTGIDLRVLGGPTDPLTLDRLVDAVRAGVDLVYLVSHGTYKRSTEAPILFLQGPNGDSQPIDGEVLTTRLAELAVPPRLVVLASCQSAGETGVIPERGTPQATLAGRIADAGVPAVVAMQGNITMATVESMMPVFFQELLRDGRIDRALAVARGRVRDRPDFWMPALFSRLRDGKLWHNHNVRDLDGPGVIETQLAAIVARAGDDTAVRALLAACAGEAAAELAMNLPGPAASRLAVATSGVATLYRRGSVDARTFEILLRALPDLRSEILTVAGELLPQAQYGRVLAPRTAGSAVGPARARFATCVRAAADLLDDDASWTDATYTELEAEAEVDRPVQGRAGATRREPGRVPSVVAAIREHLRGTDAHPIARLEAAPGSGKSVAMRRAAREMAGEEGPVPLYVSLRDLPFDTAVDAGAIERHCLATLARLGGPGISDLLPDACLDLARARGWCFLFDSFDETPIVLRSTEPDAAITALGRALATFVAGYGCRAVVASRPYLGPSSESWLRIRLLPLTNERRDGFVRQYLPDPAQADGLLAWLQARDTSLGVLSDNPLFLALACAHQARAGEPPHTVHEVFDGFCNDRLEGDAARLRLRWGVDAAQVRMVAEEAAIAMVEDAGLGLEPGLAPLTRALTDRGLDVDVVGRGLSALNHLRLGILGSDGERRFKFSHRRFQEYFATCVALRVASRVPAQTLLLDAAWRETAVTLLQSQEGPGVDALLLAARRFVAAGPAGELRDGVFRWRSGWLHVVGILQDGRGGRIEEDFCAELAAAFDAAWHLGGVAEQAALLEGVGCLRPAEARRYLEEGMRTSGTTLVEVCLRQVGWGGVVDGELANLLGLTLQGLAQTGQLGRDRLRVETWLRRLPEPGPALEAVRLMLLGRRLHPIAVGGVATLALLLAGWAWALRDEAVVNAAAGAVFGTVLTAFSPFLDKYRIQQRNARKPPIAGWRREYYEIFIVVTEFFWVALFSVDGRQINPTTFVCLAVVGWVGTLPITAAAVARVQLRRPGPWSRFWFTWPWADARVLVPVLFLAGMSFVTDLVHTVDRSMLGWISGGFVVMTGLSVLPLLARWAFDLFAWGADRVDGAPVGPRSVSGTSVLADLSRWRTHDKRLRRAQHLLQHADGAALAGQAEELARLQLILSTEVDSQGWNLLRSYVLAPWHALGRLVPPPRYTGDFVAWETAYRTWHGDGRIGWGAEVLDVIVALLARAKTPGPPPG